jgi:hypothetical protein
MISSASPVSLVDASGEELRTLLSPISPEIFVREYWAKKPLFVKGFEAKFKGFFDGETFSRALSPGPAPEDFLRASFDRKTESGESAPSRTPDAPRSSAFRASVEQAVPLFGAGATLCVSQIETRVPSLVPFIAAIKRQLGYPGRVCFNAYLSPPGSGFNWHFDSRIASTLQIEGTKRWRFSNRPTIAWPRANGTLWADGTAHYTDPTVVAQDWEQLAAFDETDTTDVLLEPGDLLILPAGVWHEARGGSGGSLALNLSFTAVSYTLLVRNLLDALLTADPGWRSPAPVLPGSAPGAADPDGVAAITDQLARAAAALQSLRGDSAAVVRLWESFVQNPNPGVPLARGGLIAAPTVHQQQRLRVRDASSVYAMLADGGSRLCLMLGTSRAIELTGQAVFFVQRMLIEREFVASDCLGWTDDGTAYAWNDVETMLTNLKREGLIEDAASGLG